MAAKRGEPQADNVIASYDDAEGRRHRIELRRSLVLDLCVGEAAVVVAELSSEEGIDQGRAAVFGGEFDPGYLARAEAGERGLGRKLRAADLAAPQSEVDQAADGPDAADDERRLAA